jgi:hypothetical protein
MGLAGYQYRYDFLKPMQHVGIGAAGFSEDCSAQAGYGLVLAPPVMRWPLNSIFDDLIHYFLAYNKSLLFTDLWRTLITMSDSSEKKGRGRPTLPPEQKRTARLSMRTYPDVEEKVRRVGTEAVEKAIRAIKEPKRVLVSTEPEGVVEYEAAMDRERP